MSCMRIALVNFNPKYDDIHANLFAIQQQLQQQSDNSIHLICFPEMCLTGYRHTEEILPLAQQLDGDVVRQLSALAQETRIAIVAGIPEWEPHHQKCYITQVCCTPNGQLFSYRKTHLSPRESRLFHGGDDVGIFRYMSFTFGQQLCYDAHFPEFSLAQTQAGAEVFLLCSASPMGNAAKLRERWLRYLPARAYDNGCYLLTCNQHAHTPDGVSFSGLAMAFDPHGALIAESREVNTPLVIDLEYTQISEARRKRSFLQLRRPDLYRLYNAPGAQNKSDYDNFQNKE